MVFVIEKPGRNGAGMKILQAIDIFSPAAGGSANVACRLSQALSRQGHEVTIYTSDFRLERGYIKSLPGIKAYAARNYLSLGGKPLLTPGILAMARRELRDFDIIHLHNYPTLPNVMVHRYARRYHVPYILQAHGSLATYFQKGFLKRVYDSLWGKTILKGAARVIAVAPMEAETYRRMGVAQNKIEIIPNGVDSAEFENLPPRGEFRKKYGLENRKIIFYLGRVHAIKGLHLLAGAFAGLSREQGDARLVIAGPDDGYLPALQKLTKGLRIEDKTIFAGPLYGKEKLQAMVDASVLVLPSAYEIFGIAVLEACLCGTPVIVTDRCGIAPEITGAMGQVITYDENELQNALLKALAAPESTGESKAKRRQALLVRFSWQILAAQVERIYRDIIEGRRGQDRV
jgi:glycosyltransferase involved in cell wall biosynthesis